MGDEEMKTLWRAQAATAASGFDLAGFARETRRRDIRAGVAFLLLAALAALGLALKLYQFAGDGNMTFANSSFEWLLAILPLFAVIATLRQYLADRLERQALSMDSRACVDYLVSKTRREIDETRTVGPWLLGAMCLLLAAAKIQSLATGREQLDNEIATIVVVVGLFVFCAALLYHRSTAFLQPRLEHLESLQRELAREAVAAQPALQASTNNKKTGIDQ